MKLRIGIGTIIPIVFIGFLANAQQELGPLKVKLLQQTTELGRMHVSLEIGDAFLQQNSDSALYWYNRVLPFTFRDSLQFAEWINQTENATKYYVAVALGYSGIILLKKGELPEAVGRLNGAIEMATSIDQPQLALYCTDNAAVELAKRKDFEKSVGYFEKSLAVYQKLNNSKGIVFCLSNLGAICANWGAYYKAASYYEKLMSLQGGAHANTDGVTDLINIAQLYQKLEEHSRSNSFLENALELSTNIGYNDALGLIYSTLGSNYFKMGKLAESGVTYQKLAAISVQTNNKRDQLLAQQNLAAIEYSQGDFEKSLEYWEGAFALSMEMGNGPAVLDALLNISNIHYHLKNFAKASEYYEKYISVSKQIGDVKTLANSYLNVGEMQVKAGGFDKAREYFGQALDIYNQNNDARGIASANIAIGQSFLLQQRFQSATDFFSANIERGQEIDEKLLADSYQGKADALRAQVQYLAALDLYVKALVIREKMNDANQATACLNSLGFIYEVTGNIPKSLESYERALQLASSQGNKVGVSAIYNNLGIVYRRLGDFNKARDSYEKALEIFLIDKNLEAASYAYNNLGIVYENLGDFTKANEYYEKSLEIKQSGQDKQGLATSLMNIGNVYKHLKNYSKAEENYMRSLALCEDISDRQGMALALGSIASLAIESKNYDKAIEYANKSLAIAKEIDLQNVIKESYRQKGWTYALMGVSEWAEEAYLNLMEMNYAEITRNFSVLSESEKELFFKTLALDFDRFHSFALKRQHSNPAIMHDVYNNILRNKGLLLKSSTSMRNAILRSNNNELIESFERWIMLRQEIAKLYALPAEERKVKPEELEKQANNLERMLVRSSSEFSDFDRSMRITWTDIRNKMREGEAAIEFTHFIHTPDSILYCAIVLLPGMDVPRMVPLFEQRQLVRLIGTYGGNNLQYINGIYGKLSEPNLKLYELIWKPIEPILKGVKRVYYSPTGLLHKISMSALTQNSNTLLIDAYDLQLLSSTGQIAAEKSMNFTPETSIGIFGGIAYSIMPGVTETWTYLKGTLDEANLLQGMLATELKGLQVVTDTLATEARFRELAKACEILHVATHGFFFPDPKEVDAATEMVKEYGEIEFRGGARTHGLTSFVRNLNPLMRSGLVFAGVNDYWNGAKPVSSHDGVLTALEVINIDMRKNQLTVMSACETGLGEIAGSEGVYGLQRAFKMAGSKYIVMSLWQVPDKETAEFMEAFYRQLLVSKNIREAFAASQKAMRIKYDPYYWAAFVLLE